MVASVLSLVSLIVFIVTLVALTLSGFGFGIGVFFSCMTSIAAQVMAVGVVMIFAHRRSIE